LLAISLAAFVAISLAVFKTTDDRSTYGADRRRAAQLRDFGAHGGTSPHARYLSRTVRETARRSKPAKKDDRKRAPL
jgi:hypothetical protein